MKRQSNSHLKLIYEELNNLNKELHDLKNKISLIDLKIDIQETLNELKNNSKIGSSNDKQDE